jgi:hypothetical protein
VGFVARAGGTPSDGAAVNRLGPANGSSSGLALMIRFAVFLGMAALCAGCAAVVPKPAGTVSAVVRPHPAWSDSATAPEVICLGNGVVEADIVPKLGRVMQFRFRDEPGVFWENESMLGKPAPENPWSVPGSFGGDKTWPAPQSLWGWPPPDVFDAAPLLHRIESDGSVVLTSPVSTRFGIRTERRVSLEPGRPAMRIVTTYRKIEGPPVDVGVWVITQAKDPVKVFLPVPKNSRFPDGLTKMWDRPTNHFERAASMIAMTRDPAGSHKIGNDSDRILWVGDRHCLRIDIPREAGAAYPDDGCSMELYTNVDPARYVELETLGPLRRLTVGDTTSATNTYTLYLRTRPTPEAEAEILLR